MPSTPEFHENPYAAVKLDRFNAQLNQAFPNKYLQRVHHPLQAPGAEEL